jgi:hypothetical protein
MFERLRDRARLRAAERTRARARRLAEAARSEVPPGVAIDEIEGGFCLSGRGLRRRFAIDAGLRWLTERLR